MLFSSALCILIMVAGCMSIHNEHDEHACCVRPKHLQLDIGPATYRYIRVGDNSGIGIDFNSNSGIGIGIDTFGIGIGIDHSGI